MAISQHRSLRKPSGGRYKKRYRKKKGGMKHMKYMKKKGGMEHMKYMKYMKYMKKKGGRKRKYKRKNPWLQFLKHFRGRHPEIPNKQMMKKASNEYHRLKGELIGDGMIGYGYFH